MSSPKFERVKQNNKGLSTLLDSLGLYVDRQLRSGETFIIPKLAAAALNLKDGEAFVLLGMLARAGILHRVYNIYCRQSESLVATVADLDHLDELPFCDHCNGHHTSSDLKIEVAFELNEGESLSKAA